MKAPEGIAGNFVLYALGFSSVAFNGYARTRRSEDVQAIGGADLMDAEEMSAITYYDDAMKAVGACNDGEAADGLISTGAFGLRDGVRLGNAGADEILLADSALRELVTALAPQNDDERSDAAAVE